MIIYAVICRAKDASILVDVLSSSDFRSNAPQITVMLMEYLRDHPEFVADGDRKTLIQRNDVEMDFFSHFMESCAVALGDSDTGTEDFFFHLFRKDDVYYCCIGDDPDPRDHKVSFAFLENICQSFTKMYRTGRIATAHAYGMNKDFAPTVRSAMHHHNVHATEIAKDVKVRQLLSQVSNLRDVVGKNIHLMLERGEDLSRLIQKSESMQQEAVIFKKRAVRLNRNQRRKDIFMAVAACLFVFILIVWAMIAVCGVGLVECRRQISQGSSGNS